MRRSSQKRPTKEAAAAGIALVVLMTHGTTEALIRNALARAAEGVASSGQAASHPH
jgi:hypothetical protein